MAVATIQVGGLFTAGTVLSAYDSRYWNPEVTRSPTTTATETQTVAANTTVTFSSLADGLHYFITDAAVTRYFSYETPSAPTGGGGGGGAVSSVAGKIGAVTLVAADVGGVELAANKGQANGYASLDAGAKVPAGQLPADVVTENVVTTDYTLVLGDADNAVAVNSATARTVTVPPNSSVPFPVGTIIEVWRRGAGSVTLVQGAGVTIEPNAALGIALQHTGVSLRKNATDSWALATSSETLGASIIDAKGDLIVATAADAPTRLAVGTDGQVLTADSSQPAGLKWAPAPSVSGGKYAPDIWLPSGALTQNFSRVGPVFSDVNPLSSGRLHLAGGTRLRAGQPYQTINFRSGGTPAGTPTHQWFCLIRASDSAILGKTTDDTTTAWAANQTKPLSFAAPYTPAQDEDAWVGILVTATTVPTLRGVNMSDSNVAFLAPAVAAIANTGLTDPASFTSLGALSANAILLYCYLS